MVEESMSKALDNGNKLKTELDEAKDELNVLKRATKTGAKDAQEVHEVKSKNDELQKDLDRLNSLAIANQREQNALDVRN